MEKNLSVSSKKNGVDVIVANGEGEFVNKTDINLSEKYCDSCSLLRTRPDPDPYDWFCDDDMAVYCAANDKTIEGALRPYQLKNIGKPEWCPKKSFESLLKENEKSTE